MESVESGDGTAYYDYALNAPGKSILHQMCCQLRVAYLVPEFFKTAEMFAVPDPAGILLIVVQ